MGAKNRNNKPKFIDLFAGCGGFSLGFLNAGFEGIFAIEKSAMAFETLSHNLLDNPSLSYNWPEWLNIEPIACEDLIENYKDELLNLTGSIDVIIGGPPCQGFSTAGRRDPGDPRNQLTEQYLKIVGVLQPKIVAIENVIGMTYSFDDINANLSNNLDASTKSYSDLIVESLSELGYSTSTSIIDTSRYGVPQNRRRHIIIGVKESIVLRPYNISEMLEGIRLDFLKSKGLAQDEKVSAGDAISDLETNKHKLINNEDSGIKGFFEIDYNLDQQLNSYQALMRRNHSKSPNSLRLPNHKPKTLQKFKVIQKECRPGHVLSAKKRAELEIKKHTISVLDRCKPAPTVTTLPDDILHYSEPRILTVREMARLQSFPDWFEFKGKYTTGGSKRKIETPRYTQVGNAVPPLFSEALAIALKKLI